MCNCKHFLPPPPQLPAEADSPLNRTSYWYQDACSDIHSIHGNPFSIVPSADLSITKAPLSQIVRCTLQTIHHCYFIINISLLYEKEYAYVVFQVGCGAGMQISLPTIAPWQGSFCGKSSICMPSFSSQGHSAKCKLQMRKSEINAVEGCDHI